MNRLTTVAGGFGRSVTRRTSGGVSVSPLGSEVQGDGLLAQAKAIEAELQAVLESAPVEQAYTEALALHVQAKHEQVARIEDRIENLIDRQQARLQQTQTRQPGILSLPGVKRAWQNQQMQQQARLQTLHARLDVVREIKEGMGLHSPRIEEMATRKLRAENPVLASDWDEMRVAARHHQQHARREAQVRKLERPGRAQSLGISRHT